LLNIKLNVKFNVPNSKPKGDKGDKRIFTIMC